MTETTTTQPERIPLDSASIIEPDVTTNTLLDLKPRGDSLGLSIFVGLF